MLLDILHDFSRDPQARAFDPVPGRGRRMLDAVPDVAEDAARGDRVEFFGGQFAAIQISLGHPGSPRLMLRGHLAMRVRCCSHRALAVIALTWSRQAAFLSRGPKSMAMNCSSHSSRVFALGGRFARWKARLP